MTYADVNGLSMYYEEHGVGEKTPLMLIHGGFGLGTEFAPILPSLTKGRTVITVDLQGHGHTADIDRPLSPDLMADDIAALIRHLELEQVDVMGYSLGGYVALQTAIRHPQLVRRLVTVSIPLKRDGWYPSVLAQHEHFGTETAEAMKQSPIYATYEAVAPRVQDWDALVTKTGESMRRDFDYTQQAKTITAPVLLVFADADAIRYEHIVDILRVFGGGQRDPGWDGSGGRGTAQLAIIPGTTHYDLGVSPKMVTAVLPFLDQDLPASPASSSAGSSTVAGMRTPPLPGPVAPLSPDRLADRAVGDRPIDVPLSAITIERYDPAWPVTYRTEHRRIRAALGAGALAVEHVGSTAVPGLSAKDRVDIDLIVADPADEDAYVPALEAAGYALRARDPDWYQHRCLWNEGHTVNLHVFAPDCDEHLRHLILRDRLRSRADDREYYEAAKRRAAADNAWSSAAYNSDKAAAIVEILRRAGLRPTRR